MFLPWCKGPQGHFISFVFAILIWPKSHKLQDSKCGLYVCMYACARTQSMAFITFSKDLSFKKKTNLKSSCYKRIFATLGHIFTSHFLHGELYLAARLACEHKRKYCPCNCSLPHLPTCYLMGFNSPILPSSTFSNGHMNNMFTLPPVATGCV